MHPFTPASRPLPNDGATEANGRAVELVGPDQDVAEVFVGAVGAQFNLQDERGAAMASKYIWWQEPRQALEDPCLLAAQIMTLGTLDDVQWLLGRTSTDTLRHVLRDAPAGIFNERSWRFWHLQFGVTPIPPLPTRPMPA